MSSVDENGETEKDTHQMFASCTNAGLCEGRAGWKLTARENGCLKGTEVEFIVWTVLTLSQVCGSVRASELIKMPTYSFSSFIVPLQGIEPRASWVQGWHSTTELQPSPKYTLVCSLLYANEAKIKNKI